MHRDFQDLVFLILLREVGSLWKDIEGRISKATHGKDVLVAARIREEISNLVDLCVYFDEAGGVLVTGIPELLLSGELYVHPTKKTLCMVGADE